MDSLVQIGEQQRIGKLRQDYFAFESHTVLDTVMMGHEKLWEIKEERNRIYSMEEMSEEDGMRAGDLEGQFADLDGYSADASAGDLLISMGIPVDVHYDLIKSIAPGWKLRVLLAQALFGDLYHHFLLCVFCTIHDYSPLVLLIYNRCTINTLYAKSRAITLKKISVSLCFSKAFQSVIPHGRFSAASGIHLLPECFYRGST